MLEHLRTSCAAEGIPVGDHVLVRQAYADDCIGAAVLVTAAGLQRITVAAKEFGDTWGCVLDVSKSAIVVVDSDAARASAPNVQFWLGDKHFLKLNPTSKR